MIEKLSHIEHQFRLRVVKLCIIIKYGTFAHMSLVIAQVLASIGLYSIVRGGIVMIRVTSCCVS